MATTRYTSPEVLESRIAPAAGVINVTFANGILQLAAADGDDHAASITANGALGIHLEATGGTMFVFNDAQSTSLDFVQPSALAYTGGAGSDIVTVDSLTKLRALTLSSGGGADGFTVNTVAVAGATTITLGDGAAGLSMGGDSSFTGKTTINANATGVKTLSMTGNQLFRNELSITTGAADDSLALNASAFTALRSVMIDMGDGTNQIIQGTVNDGNGIVKVGGNLTFIQGDHAAGTSVTNFFPAQTSIGGTLSFVQSSGTNSVGFGSSSFFRAGALRVIGGADTDTVSIGGGAVTGDMTIGTASFDGRLGALTVAANVPNLTFGSATVQGGADNLVMTVVGSNFRVGKSLTVTLGDATTNTVLLASSNTSIGTNLLLSGGTGEENISFFSSSLTVGKVLRVNGGEGLNTINLVGDILRVGVFSSFSNGDHATGISTINLALLQSSFGRGLQIQNGSGTDAVFIATGTSLQTTGNFDIGLGGGNDTATMQIEGLNVRGRFAIEAGDGTNDVNVIATNLKVGGEVSFRGGTGTDNMTLAFAGTAQRHLTVDTGIGSSTINASGIFFGGLFRRGISIQSAAGAGDSETTNIFNLSSTGPVRIATGAADSTVTVNNLIDFSTFSLTTGDGADTVNIERSNTAGPSVIAALASINLGAGADTLKIGNASQSDNVLFGNRLLIDGGDGTDTVNDGIADVEDANTFAGNFGATVTNVP